MQKWYPKSHQNGLQKGPQKRTKTTKMGSKSHPKMGFQQKHRTIMIFSTLNCGSCIINNSKIDDFHVLILTPFWVSFWRCFGSPNGGQGHQKATSKKTLQNYTRNEPKLVPKGVPQWSQNRQKWGLRSTLSEGGLPSGLQSPSRIDFGEVLGPFSSVFLTYFWWFCMHSVAACCKQIRSKS